jgi:lipid-A-disaccharide synthase
MRIFISAGEPSGDLHGANLASALHQQDPNIECVGFGGPRMEAVGCQLLFPLSRLAVMGFFRFLLDGLIFLKLLSQADRYFRHQRPDFVVLIDFPGFNWWIARRARFHGIPVLYFVPPQLWAWAGWRVRKVRRFIDRVLCTLPFEEVWYRERGVNADYVGHPYYDELAGQPLDQDFITRQQAIPGPVIGLLPGSRSHEVKDNLSTLIHTAEKVLLRRPDCRFLVACFKSAHHQYVDEIVRSRGLPIQVCQERTAEIIALAHACVAVSGSVSLELLYRTTPTVVIYRTSRFHMQLVRWLKKCRFISLVNLLADRELFPEYLGVADESASVSGHLLRWLNDESAYQSVRNELRLLRERVAEPGACRRAAEMIVSLAEKRSRRTLRQAA